MQLPAQLSRDNIPEPLPDTSRMFQLMMQNILESAQSDPEMLTTLSQLLGGQAKTSGGAAGAATTEGARLEEVVIVINYS